MIQGSIQISFGTGSQSCDNGTGNWITDWTVPYTVLDPPTPSRRQRMPDWLPQRMGPCNRRVADARSFRARERSMQPARRCQPEGGVT